MPRHLTTDDLLAPAFGGALDARYYTETELNAMMVRYDAAQTLTAAQKAQALKNIGSAWETIYDQAFSAVPNVSITDLSAYRTLRINYYIAPSVDGTTLLLRTSTNNGSSYDAGASDYSYQIAYSSGSSALAASGNTGQIFLYLSDVGNAVGEFAAGEFKFHEFNQAKYMSSILNQGNTNNAGVLYTGQLWQKRLQATARNAFLIFPGSGGTISGYMTVEGIRG